MSDKPKRSAAAKVGRVFSVIGKILGTLFLVGILTGLVFATIFAKYVKEDLSKEAEFSMDGFDLEQTSVIYYTDPETGEPVELQELYGAENRTWVSYKDIPTDLRFACIAIEDKRFYKHQGVDWLRTIKASVHMFLGSGSAYGGSTLTQQLIKNVTGERDVTVRRKLVEIVRALEFEKKYSKEQILEWYFNTIYLGEGCYGVQSASQVYFGKDVSDLTLAECASLIGITNNPSIFDPYLNEENNRKRQLDILYVMKQQGYILTQEEYDAAVAQEMVFVNNSAENDTESGNGYYSYFVDQVIRDVTADIMAKEGYSETFASQMVRKGGYAIYCTLNPEVQAKMDAVYTDTENIPKTDSAQQLQSGMVIMDNQTGDVVAMVGGVGEKTGSLTFNRATQSLLSPGSTIKPITVYGPALDQGLITPASVYDDTPYSFEGGNWPKNTDNTYRGLMSVNTAVSLSTNTIAVKVLADLTPEYSYAFAHDKLGMLGLVDNKTVNGQIYSDINLAPLALGGLTNGVTIEQMTGAYAAYANGGLFRQPRTYSKILDQKGEIYMDNTKEPVKAVSKKAAWYMTYLLNNAVNSGTGSPAQIKNMAVAGKTGTTTSDQDRWFCGYTPYYTAAVWCGFDEPEEVNLTESRTNPSAYLWQKVMAEVHKDLEPRQFDRPTDLIKCYYCRDSGLLATSACNKDPRGSRQVEGYLVAEDAPKSYCDVHTEVELCKESGQIANEYCPQVEGNKVYKAGLLQILRAFPGKGIYVNDQQYVIADGSKIPKGYHSAVSGVKNPPGAVCTLHTQQSLPVVEPELPPEAQDPALPPSVFDPENPENPTVPTDPTVPENPLHENPDDAAPVPND